MKVYIIPNISIQKEAPHCLKQGTIVQSSTRSCLGQGNHKLIKLLQLWAP